MAKSIKRNFVYNILLNVSSVIFPLITAPYVARVLEPEGVGLFNFSQTYAGYFALVALLGIPKYGIREVSRIRDKMEEMRRLVSQLMTIAFITTIGVTVIYFTTIALIGQLRENYIIFFLAGFTVYLAPFNVNWYYQGMEEFGFITLRSVIIRTVSVVCLFLFVHEKDDLVIYVILGMLGTVVADIWNYLKMVQSGIRPHFTLDGIKPHMKPLLLLFASSIAISVYTVLNTIMLGFIKDYSEVAYYRNASHISQLVLMIVTSLSTVVIPRFSYYIKSRDIEQANKLAKRSFSFVVFLSFPMAMGLMCLSPVFIPWFYGVQFQGAVLPMMILSVLIIAIGMSNICGIQIMIGLGMDKQFLNAILCGTFANFTLNCLLIPQWGAVGSSVASVVAEMLITCVMLWIIYRQTPIRIGAGRDTVKALIGSLSFIPVAYFMPVDWPSLLYILCYVTICASLYFASQWLLRSDSMRQFYDMFVSLIKKE